MRVDRERTARSGGRLGAPSPVELERGSHRGLEGRVVHRGAGAEDHLRVVADRVPERRRVGLDDVGDRRAPRPPGPGPASAPPRSRFGRCLPGLLELVVGRGVGAEPVGVVRRTSVSKKPGSTIATLIPKWSTSSFSASVRPSSANFVPEYMPSSGGDDPARRPTVTLTIVPLPRSRICGSTAWIMRSAPKKFVSNMLLALARSAAARPGR